MTKRTDSAVRARPRRQEKVLQALRQFRVIIRSIRWHYAEVERRAGLSGAQLWALAHIGRQPGCRAGELAEALAIHPSTASNLLRTLEGLNLVRRQRHGKDQRQVQLLATAKGRQVLKRAPRPLIGVLQQALFALSPAELDQLNEQLERIVALMKTKRLEARATPLSEI